MSLYDINFSLFIAAMFVAQPLLSVRGNTGRDAVFMCRLASSDEHPPTMSYQWYKGESRDSNDFRFLKGETSNILHLESELCVLLQDIDPGEA